LKRGPSSQWLHFALVVLIAFAIAGFVQAIAERHSVRFDFTPTPIVLALGSLAQGACSAHRSDRGDGVHLARRRRQGDRLDAPFPRRGAELPVRGARPRRNPGSARQAASIATARRCCAIGSARSWSTPRASSRSARSHAAASRAGDSRRVPPGHGERALEDVTAPIGYGQLRQALVNESYEVGSFNLMKDGDVPAGVDLVIVAGRRTIYSRTETKVLDRYLAAGGHVALWIDPVPLPNLVRFAARHGIDSPLDVVVDRSNQILGSDPFTVPIPTYMQHPITASSSTPALFAVARSVVVNESFAGAKAASVAASYPDAWAIADFERATHADQPPKPEEDRKGPVPVMAAASWSTRAARRGSSLSAIRISPRTRSSICSAIATSR